MSRASASTDRRLVELFLDMLAAERGAAANTLAAYRRDLDDFAVHLLLNRNVGHTSACRRAMPVFHTRWRPHHIALIDLLLFATPFLNPARSSGDD